MRKWTKARARGLSIDILLFDGFSNHCLANTLEPFRAANRLAGEALYHWRVLTPDGGAARSSSGLTLLPDGALRAVEAPETRPDMLIVAPSYGHRALAVPDTTRALRAASARAGLTIGLDTGAWLMAAAGLLDGRAATIHWDEIDAFAETFLNVSVRRARSVRDGPMLTCGGAMAAFDLMLELIGEAQGEALRLDVAAMFLFAAEAERPPRARRAIVARAVALMREHLETPLAAADLCAALGVSQRTLARAFRAEFGAPPGQVSRRLRLNAARRLIEDTAMPVSEVALRSGYADPAAMTRAFREEFGVAPRAIRAGGACVPPP